MKDTLNAEDPGDWDSPVSDKLVKEWSMAVKEGISQDSLWFSRSTTSPRAVKKPRLVGFWDGSSQAFSAVIYAVTMISKTEEINLDVLPDGDIHDKDFDPAKHEFVSHILAAKARVTPLRTGLTIPRAEVSGLLLCSRLMSKGVSLYDGGFSVASCLGDSTCIISALEKNATSFNPFMHARLSEIFNLREKIAAKTHLEEVFHVISSENIADICTRRESSLQILGPGSVWQSGPHWLREPRYNWPCNRDFAFRELPSEETKTPIRVVMAAKVTNSLTSSMVQFALNQYWTFSEATFSLARTISAVKQLRRDFAPLSDCIKQAKSLMFEESMKETDELITQGRLNGYDIQTKEGINRSIHYTTGRFGKETLMKLYGIPELPVLHASTKLALLIMREAHSGADSLNHRRSPSDIIGRARQYALIYKPYSLALQVSKSCPRCILEEVRRKPVQQKIGQLDANCLTPSPPFSDVSADLAGPFRIKFRERKIWILIYLCNVTKALHLQLVENYSAKAVTTALNTVFGIRNLPNKITTDAGKNVVKSRKTIIESLQSSFSGKDLEEIQATWPQITWCVIPPDAPHRLGGAESMVKATKRSLRYLPTSSLTLLEFDAAIKNIASTINNRPLGFHVNEDDVLTPNQLLLGRNYDPVHPPDRVLEANITVLLPHVRNIVSSWFLRWNNIVIPQLFKISKWETGHPDLKEGDLCLLHQKKGKCGIRSYKYCRVHKLVPSERDSKVRTVEVKYYNSPSKKAKYSTVDVRKLSLIPDLKS